jgi:hypothetical protein
VTAVLIVVAVLVVVVAVVAVVRARRARHSDGVETFRRQIDALSPEARRPVVDRVQRLEEEAAEPPAPPAGETDDEDRA